MCDYVEGGFQCRGDGFVHEIGQRFDINDFVDPCPKCNSEVFLKESKSIAEAFTIVPGGKSGSQFWRESIEKAGQFMTEKSLSELLVGFGKVKTLATKNDQMVVEIFDYERPVERDFMRAS